MENVKTCGGCALFHKTQGACLRTKTPTSASEFCSHFINSVPSCGVCGQLFIPPVTYILEDDKIIEACPQCANSLSTCRTCTNQKVCDFQTNPINIPPQIQQRVQNGNMVVVQTVINPARVAETCEKGCLCWDPIDRVCNKQTVGTCGNGYKPSFLP